VSDYKEDARAAPPAGLIVEKAREETLIRGRHTDAWGFLKGLEEADHEERFLR
jgi:shikimate 5-dehydrogenase